MSCLLSYYNTVPFPLQSNLRSVFCTFCIPHLFQLLQNLGCSCAGSVFSHLKCKISTSDCAGSSFSSLNAQFQPQIVQNSLFSSLNAQSVPGIMQSRKCSSAFPLARAQLLSLAIFLRHTRLILAKCFCFTKEACPLKQTRKKLAHKLLRLRRVVSSAQFSSNPWRSSRSVFMS